MSKRDEALALADALEKPPRFHRIDDAIALLRQWPDQSEAQRMQEEIDDLRDRITELEAHTEVLSEWVVTRDKRIAALEAENAKLRTVMVAAAEEIHKHWEAHCDAEGYGPANLMHRLEKGIPVEYGYTAGAFEKQRKRIKELEAAAQEARSALMLCSTDSARANPHQDRVNAAIAALDRALGGGS